MTTISKRMRALKTLLALKLGNGAVVFPPDSVKALHLRFAFKSSFGHLGPRKFWRNYLPRLKYYNPGVRMSVQRSEQRKGPAILEIVFASPPTSGSAVATEQHQDERVQEIDMKDRSAEDILASLIQATQAIEVPTSDEDAREVRRLEDEKTQSEYDKKISLALRTKIRREKAIMEAAKGETNETSENTA